jgi:hypothetical protein
MQSRPGHPHLHEVRIRNGYEALLSSKRLKPDLNPTLNIFWSLVFDSWKETVTEDPSRFPWLETLPSFRFQ